MKRARGCDREVCYNGLPKRKVSENILTVYSMAYEEMRNRFPKGRGPFLVGSVVTGTFGCRTMEKIAEESRFVFGGYPHKERKKVKAIIRRSSTPKEFVASMQRISGTLSKPQEVVMSDTYQLACSDIDIFMSLPLPRKKVQKLQFKPEVRQFINRINKKARGILLSNLDPSIGIRGEEFMKKLEKEPHVNAPSEYKELLKRRYY